MKTIKEKVVNEIVIKNSRFITLFFPLENKNITPILEEVRKKYPKATHYCYAYIYDKEKGFSDDGEPSKTAGMPMLNVLEKEELTNILGVTVRYFGGIKLGAGGLVRAYTKSFTDALQKASLVSLYEAYKIRITFPYSDEKQINYLLQDANILKREYQDFTIYTTVIEKEKMSLLDHYSYEILEECLIKKDS